MPQFRWKLGSPITLDLLLRNKNLGGLSLIFFSCCLFLLVDSAKAQFLRNFLQEDTNETEPVLRDDRPSQGSDEELLYEDIICRDIDNFPNKINERHFSSYSECKIDLDRIERGSYIDLTYRIRWDNDRLDLYLRGFRQIYICDGPVLSLYEHSSREDPDWWMISRNTLDLVSCSSDEIIIENLE